MRIQNIFLRQTLDLGHGAQDGVKRADAQRIVVGDSQPMVARGIGLQDDMAAFLIDPPIAVMLAEELD